MYVISSGSSSYHGAGFVRVDGLDREGVSRKGRATECFEHLDSTERKGKEGEEEEE